MLRSVRSTWDGARLIAHPGVAATIPAALVLAFWAGGEDVLFGAAAALSLVGLIGWMPQLRRAVSGPRDGETGLPPREAAVRRLEALSEDGSIVARRVATLAVGIEEARELRRRLGDSAMSGLMAEAASRIARTVRQGDLVVRLEGAVFGVVLDNLRRADLEMLIQIAARIQRELSEPFETQGARVYATVSVGFCLPNRAPDRTGEALLTAAERALREARDETGGAIRAYSGELQARDRHVTDLADSAAEALSRGEIKPWFQPQISTDTGEVTGFEALARWERKAGDVLCPGDFLAALEARGLLERLGETMLSHALAAMADWDAAGLTVPNVALNISRVELKNGRYIDRVRWELDRFDIAPARLTLEIRDTMPEDGPEDMSVRNLWDLARLGCRIDLDRFGTGATPLVDIRRFSVGRVKIDRSVVARVDRDPNQQRMVAALLTLAEQLELDTVADGVETVGEHAMLAQLGCAHVQGFAVAQPMPGSAVPRWLAGHADRPALPVVPATGRAAQKP